MMGVIKGFWARLALAFMTMFVVIAASTVPVYALVPVVPPPPGPPPPGPPTEPGPVVNGGPRMPYIAGRLGGARQLPSNAPTGTVVPDDFCLPGKLDDCGSHLRDAPETQDSGPIFVGGEDDAFFQANYSAWANAQFRRTFLATISETHSITSYSMGVDRRFGENLMFGVMVNSSQSQIDFAVSGILDSSSGFSYGPYFGVRVSETMFLDARYHVGTFSHDISTAGAATGNYESNDSFASLRLSAEISRGSWDIFPSLEFAQIRQDNAAYTDTIRGAIPASVVTQQYATLAALGYYNGFAAFTPYVGMELSRELGRGGLIGALRAGATFNFDSGANLNIDYALGGIGLNGVDDQQISIRFEFPF